MNTIKVILTKAKIKDILKNENKGVTVKFTYNDLLHGKQNLLVSTTDYENSVKALQMRKGINIHLSSDVIKENIKSLNLQNYHGGFLPALIPLLPSIAAAATALAGATGTALNIRKLVKGDGLQHLRGKGLGEDMNSIIHNFLIGLNSLSDGQKLNTSALIPLLVSGALAGSSYLTDKKGKGVTRGRPRTRSVTSSRASSRSSSVASSVASRASSRVSRSSSKKKTPRTKKAIGSSIKRKPGRPRKSSIKRKPGRPKGSSGKKKKMSGGSLQRLRGSGIRPPDVRSYP